MQTISNLRLKIIELINKVFKKGTNIPFHKWKENETISGKIICYNDEILYIIVDEKYVLIESNLLRYHWKNHLDKHIRITKDKTRYKVYFLRPSLQKRVENDTKLNINEIRERYDRLQKLLKEYNELKKKNEILENKGEK